MKDHLQRRKPGASVVSAATIRFGSDSSCYSWTAEQSLLFSFEAWMVYSVLPEFGGCQTSGFFDGTKSCSPNCGTGNSLGASGTRWRGRVAPVSFSSSILRCNVMKAWMSASGRGGQPG